MVVIRPPRVLNQAPTFAPNRARLHLPESEQMRADFAQIRALGGNCARVYHRPPRWVLDLALEHDLRVFVDVPWEKHRCFKALSMTSSPSGWIFWQAGQTISIMD